MGTFKLIAENRDAAFVLLRGLRIAARFASTDDARPVLTAVHVVSTGKEVRIEATDSYTLARIVWPHKADKFGVLIPADWIKRVVPAPRKRSIVDAYELSGTTLNTDTMERGTVTFADNVEREVFTGRTLLGGFVNVESILASASPAMDGEERCFNPRYLHRVLKAAAQWGGVSHPVRLRQLETMTPARLDVRCRAGADLTMLLMPVREA